MENDALVYRDEQSCDQEKHRREVALQVRLDEEMRPGLREARDRFFQWAMREGEGNMALAL